MDGKGQTFADDVVLCCARAPGKPGDLLLLEPRISQREEVIQRGPGCIWV